MLSYLPTELHEPSLHSTEDLRVDATKSAKESKAVHRWGTYVDKDGSDLKDKGA